METPITQERTAFLVTGDDIAERRTGQPVLASGIVKDTHHLGPVGHGQEVQLGKIQVVDRSAHNPKPYGVCGLWNNWVTTG